MKYRLVIPPAVEQTLIHLPPNLKRKVRSALEAIREEPSLGKPLKDELKGLWSYPVSRYRIVYRIQRHMIEIQIIDIAPRSVIYEHIVALIKSES